MRLMGGGKGVDAERSRACVGQVECMLLDYSPIIPIKLILRNDLYYF
jgi:hypothetical protein